MTENHNEHMSGVVAVIDQNVEIFIQQWQIYVVIQMKLGLLHFIIIFLFLSM